MSEASRQDYLFLGFNSDKNLGAVKCKHVVTTLERLRRYLDLPIFGPCIGRTRTEYYCLVLLSQSFSIAEDVIR